MPSSTWRKRKGAGARNPGHFAAGKLPDMISTSITIDDYDPDRAFEAWEQARAATDEYTRLQEEGLRSGNTSPTAPELVAARVKMIRTTEYELSMNPSASHDYVTAEDVPVIICRTCGSVEVLQDGSASDGDEISVDRCQRCINWAARSEVR